MVTKEEINGYFLDAIRLLKAEGYTQKDIVEAAGLSQNAISKIKAGQNNAGDDTINKLCNAFKLNPDFFYQVYFAENNRRAAWDLLQAIKNKQEPLAGIDSAIHSLEMIIGIYQSAINHMPAALPLKDRRHPLS